VTLKFPDSGAEGFLVHGYESVDAVNELFEIRLEVSNVDAELDVTTVVGETIEIHLKDEAFVKLRKGLVRRVRQLSSEPTGTSLFEIIVVPPLWLTTRRRDSRIFQDAACDEICDQILAIYGARVPAPKIGGIELPRPEYRVQYDETDHDFLFRIFAEEGVTTFFDEEGDGAFNVMNGLGLFVVTRDKDIPFVPPAGSGSKQTQPHVLSVAITSDLETSKVTVRDYDFKKPKFKLEKSKDTKDPLFSKEKDLEQYEFLNNKFTTSAEKRGEVIAEQHLDEARSRRRTFECKTNFYLPSGTAFVLSGHPRPDVNIELRIIRSHMRLTGATGTPEYTLLCIPNDHPFRPARHPKPRIFGTHLAVVVGETDGSADIDIDQFGRVKVEFHWDRRDLHLGNPTRFVRVSQGWAGAGFGMVLHPRVGHEVIIAYLDGDPDEPMIIGRLHNEHNVTPLKLPAKKTQSIWRSQTTPSGEGHNEIMMEDQQGKELLELHAQRDNLFTVNAQQDIDVGAKRNDHVKGDVTRKYDADHFLTVKGNETIKVGATRDETVTGTVTENYGPRHTEIHGTKWEKAAATTILYKSLDTTVDALHHEKFGTIKINGGNVTAMPIGEVLIDSGEARWSVGGALLHLTSNSVTIVAAEITFEAPSVKINSDHVATKATGFLKDSFTTKNGVGIEKFEAVAISGAVNGSKTEATGLSMSRVGMKADSVGIKLDHVGIATKKYGLAQNQSAFSGWQAAVSIGTFGFKKI
jgi:type VI secretion system secreted protein VgrG